MKIVAYKKFMDFFASSTEKWREKKSNGMMIRKTTKKNLLIQEVD